MRSNITLLATTLFCIGNIYCGCSSGTGKSDNDSIAAARLEAARLDSLRQDSIQQDSIRREAIRQDSIAYFEFTSPDLQFMNIKGHVKEIHVSYLQEFIDLPFFNGGGRQFSYDGNLIGGNGIHNPMRNNDGYITQYLVSTDDEDYITVLWDASRIEMTTLYYKTYNFGRKVTTATWKDGSVVAYTVVGYNKNDEMHYKVVGKIEYLTFDDYGNWTSLNVKQEKSYPNGVKDYWGNVTAHETEYKTDKLTREITYYPRQVNAEENAAWQKKVSDDYDRLKAEADSRKIPDWMKGVWYLDIDGPNGVSVANYKLTVNQNGKNAKWEDGKKQKNGICYVEDGYLVLTLFDNTSIKFKISGQSLQYRQYTLKKEGAASAFNGTFRTDSDVMSYLTDRVFYSSNHRMAFTYNAVTLDGRTISGAPRISNFSSSSATIVVNPIGGGRSVYLYLNAANGTINYDGDIFRAR